MKNSTEVIGLAFNPSQLHTIGIAALLSGSISILGSCFMILSFFLFLHKLKALFFRLVFILSIADLGCSIVVVFGASHLVAKSTLSEGKSFTCQTQAFGIQLFYQVANCYIIMIAVALYRAIVLKKNKDECCSRIVLPFIYLGVFYHYSIITFKKYWSFGICKCWAMVLAKLLPQIC